MRRLQNREGGFLKWILLAIVALVIASYFFGFSLRDAIENEQTQENFAYIKEKLGPLYESTVGEYGDDVWNWVKDTFFPWVAKTAKDIKEHRNPPLEDILPSINLGSDGEKGEAKEEQTDEAQEAQETNSETTTSETEV